MPASMFAYRTRSSMCMLEVVRVVMRSYKMAKDDEGHTPLARKIDHEVHYDIVKQIELEQGSSRTFYGW